MLRAESLAAPYSEADVWRVIDKYLPETDDD